MTQMMVAGSNNLHPNPGPNPDANDAHPDAHSDVDAVDNSYDGGRFQ